MSNVAQHNRRQHNRGASSAPGALSLSAQRWSLEVRSAVGGLLAGIDGYWRDAQWEQQANVPATLSFSMPYSSTVWAYVNEPRQIWLRNSQGSVEEKFWIVESSEETREDGAAVIQVECQSLMYQLGKETIINYEAGNEQQTITTAATGGTFKLSFRGQTTSDLNYNASTATIQSALEGLSTIGAGNVAVTGSAGAWVVTWQGDFAAMDVPKVRIRDVALTGTDTRIAIVTTRATKTIADIVRDWLSDHQLHSYNIIYGHIDAAIGAEVRAIKIENKSIMEALHMLHATIGGYMYVDGANRRFYWKRAVGRNTGQYIKIGSNGKGLKKSIDFSGLSNRIIAYGKGETLESAVTVTVNDAGSQGTYGIIPQVIVNRAITTTADLTEWANAYLEYVSTPRTRYECGTIDIANLDASSYLFFALEIGSRIKVVDTTLGVTLSTTICKISRTLDRPLDTQIDVTNPDNGNEPGSPATIQAAQGDLADTIADLYEDALGDNQDNGFEDALDEHLPDVLNGGNEDIIGALENALSGLARLGSGTPERVSTSTGSAGSATTAAPFDHTHQEAADTARMYSRADYTTLNALTVADADFGYIQDSDVVFARAATAWRTLGVIKAANYASLPTTGIDDGALGYTTGDHNRYIKENGTWRVLGMYRQAAAPSSQGERSGDLWLDTDDHRLRYKDNSTNWVLLPAINPVNNIQAGDIANGSSITSMYYTTSASARVTHI